MQKFSLPKLLHPAHYLGNALARFWIVAMMGEGRHTSPRRLTLVSRESSEDERSFDHADYIAGVQRGDEIVFTALVREYVVPLTRYAFSFLGDEDAADDIVQDMFARIWQLGVDWRPRESVSAYLYASVRHRALDALRNAHTRERLQAAVQAHYDPVEERMDPYVDVALMTAMRRGFQELTERQRDVIRLRYGQGRSFSEIAEVLGIDVRAAERLAHRAIAGLRKWLGSKPA